LYIQTPELTFSASGCSRTGEYGIRKRRKITQREERNDEKEWKINEKKKYIEEEFKIKEKKDRKSKRRRRRRKIETIQGKENKGIADSVINGGLLSGM
jgi:hypothetical protein